MRILLKIIGLFLSALSFLGCLASIYSILDPRGSQLSNDGDPFGTPPTVGESSLHLFVWFLLFVLGLWLIFRKGKNKATVTTDQTPGADEICDQCGHLFNPHRLLGYGEPPTEGWMECPVEGCECKMTWSMDPNTSDNIKNLFKPPTN